MVGDMILFLTLSFPTALVGLTVAVHKAQRNREIAGAQADQAWNLLSQEQGLTFLGEHSLESRFVERAICGQRAGLELALETATHHDSRERLTRVRVRLQPLLPEGLLVFERELAPAQGLEGRRVRTGDADFDAHFLVYTQSDSRDTCALLRVEVRAALLRLARVTRQIHPRCDRGVDPAASPRGEATGAFVRQGTLCWAVPGEVVDTAPLRQALEACLDAAVALRASATSQSRQRAWEVLSSPYELARAA